MKVNTEKQHNSTTLKVALSKLDGRYFDEFGWPLKSEAEFIKVMADLETLVTDREMKTLRNDLRSKLKSFVNNGNAPYGTSNVDIMGSYISGDKPKKNNDLNKRSARLRGQKMYVDALVHGFNELLKEKGFKFQKNSDYSTPEEALIALEADSISSKGPYDNGSEDQAIKTVNANLEGVLSHRRWTENMFAHMERYFDLRLEQIKGHINIDHKLETNTFVKYMESRGLKDTMRGWPFYCSGSDKIREHQYATSQWIFEGIDIKFPAWELVSEKTVDEFIEVIITLLKTAGIKSNVWFNLRHSFIIPISRNQGSAWKIDVDGDQLYNTDERKDMKYRLVTPISAFVQAYCIMGMKDFVTNIVKTRGRIGLQKPELNDARMNQFINLAKVVDQILISTDFTSYDSTVSGQELSTACALGIASYTDEWVQDSFSLAASSLVHKTLILPTDINDPEGLYSNFSNVNMDYVKGDKNFKAKENLKQMNIEEEIDQVKDYRARAFYIWTGYLPSGHFFTNTGGSEVTLFAGKIYLAVWLFEHGYITQKEFIAEVLAIASGDDLVQGVPKRLYDQLGYQAVLELIEKAFSEYGKFVKASKQIKILLNGYPIIDFLQKVRFQQFEEIFQQEYRKFMRQFTSLPYTERYSSLPFVGQYVIVLGKAESGLCVLNTENAAKVLVSAGKHLHQTAQETNFKVPISREISGLRDKMSWDKTNSVDNSELLGLRQLMGLVKNYGQGTLSALGKFLALSENVDTLIKTFDVELETRAPHRAELAKAMYRALGREFEDQAGEAVIGTESSTETYFYSIEMLQKMIEIAEESVTPVILEKQKQAGIPGQVGENDEGYDDPDAYEI